MQNSNCKKVGVCQKKITINDDKISPMKLFISKICVFFSYLVKSFIKIASKPKQIAPKIETNATGSTYRLEKSGLIKIKAPANVIIIAIQLYEKYFSFNIIIENIIAKTGFEKLRATASFTGIRLDEPNKIVAPIHPNDVLARCSLGFGDSILILLKKVNINTKTNPYKNLDWLIWNGLNGSPK